MKYKKQMSESVTNSREIMIHPDLQNAFADVNATKVGAQARMVHWVAPR